MLSHVDLCSGIGGFALGFQWAGLSKPVLFCDIEPWSRKVLAKHWPDVPIAEDVKELANDPDGLIPRTDPKRTILTAGYPCQPFSHAGKRLGHADDRHIWPYILQIVAHKRPAFCIFENVYGHVSMGLDQVLLDLEAEGYATRPFIVPACAVDAPHRRDRVWIIAKDVSDTDSSGQQQSNQEMAREPSEQSDSSGVQPGQTMADTKCKQRERGLSGHGQAFGAREGWSPKELARFGEDVADTSVRELQRRGQEQVYEQPDIQMQSGRGSQGEPPQRSTLSGLGGMADGIPRWLDEPGDTPRTVKGVKGRADRLKGLGNAIVPQIAMKIGEAIKASIDA